MLVPQGADQFENALACEQAGAARVLRPGELDASAVREAVLSVIGADSREREVARRLAQEITAMPVAEDAVAVVESLVAS